MLKKERMLDLIMEPPWPISDDIELSYFYQLQDLQLGGHAAEGDPIENYSVDFYESNDISSTFSTINLAVELHMLPDCICKGASEVESGKTPTTKQRNQVLVGRHIQVKRLTGTGRKLWAEGGKKWASSHRRKVPFNRGTDQRELADLERVFMFLKRNHEL